ncbi:flavin monoamine oxidase family protein [Streptomyces virginiae]
MTTLNIRIMSTLEIPRTPAEGFTPSFDTRKRVIIIGAGVAGLVAGLELARQGHELVILEAQGRVGGRVYTLRSFAPGLYAEAGAMRIPRIHELTIGYCRSFGLNLRPFVMECPQAPIYLAGRRTTWSHIDQNSDQISFDLTSRERTLGHRQLWLEATRDIRLSIQRYGQAAFRDISERYGDYSIREFLVERGYSEGAIELYGILSYRESNMNTSLIEHLREVLGGAFEDMYEIAGGMDQLPESFLKYLQNEVHFDAQVFAVEQLDDGVTVRYRTHGGVFEETGDYCICTVPFGVLRHFDFRPGLSVQKYRAIRALNYNPSTKLDVYGLPSNTASNLPMGLPEFRT